MAIRYIQRPAILLDPRKGRIRIYKYTLHFLGDPDFIVLIVSPYNQSFMITRSEKTDPRAYNLGRTLPDNDRSPEISNVSLVRELFTLNDDWDKRRPYRVYGEASLDRKAISFKSKDSVVFLGEGEWEK